MSVNWRSRFFVAALLLVAVYVFFTVFYEPWLWSIATLLFAAGGAYEWGRLCGFRGNDNLLYIGAFLLFAALASWWGGDLFVQQTYFGLVALFWVAIAPWWTLKKWAINRLLSAALGLLILYAVWSAVSLLYEHDLRLLFAGMVLVWVFDSASYFVGRAIGKTPLAPTISPKKTVEGFLGGVGAILIGGIIYNHTFADEKAALAVVLSAAFSLAVLAALGDMFVSALKRSAGAKDSGRLLGDHGGILDRTDSLLSVLPMVALLSPWIA